jgi:hypothetical protein
VNAGCDVFTAVAIASSVFWINVAPCTSLEGSRPFAGTSRFRFQNERRKKRVLLATCFHTLLSCLVNFSALKKEANVLPKRQMLLKRLNVIISQKRTVLNCSVDRTGAALLLAVKD